MNLSQFNWRSVVGFLSILAGFITSLSSSLGLGSDLAPWLVGAGAVVVAAERIAQALEAPSSTTVATALSASEVAAEKLLADFKTFQASGGTVAHP